MVCRQCLFSLPQPSFLHELEAGRNAGDQVRTSSVVVPRLDECSQIQTTVVDPSLDSSRFVAD